MRARLLGKAAICQRAGGEPLERGAHRHALGNLADGEHPHREAPRARGDEQPFLGQHRQGLTHGGARQAEHVGHLGLGDALARREPALQDHLAQTGEDIGFLFHGDHLERRSRLDTKICTKGPYTPKYCLIPY